MQVQSDLHTEAAKKLGGSLDPSRAAGKAPLPKKKTSVANQEEEKKSVFLDCARCGKRRKVVEIKRPLYQAAIAAGVPFECKILKDSRMKCPSKDQPMNVLGQKRYSLM